MTKKVIIADIIIFILVSIYATFTAARVDAGSWTNADPINEVGHYMSMKEAVIYDIPLGISVGLVVAGFILAFYFAGIYIYRVVDAYREES